MNAHVSNESLAGLRGLPPLAGLCTHATAARPGLAVDATVARLRRYVFLKTQSVFIQAALFNGVPEWEVKGAFSLHLWQDAEHSTWLRARIIEMRTPPHHLDKVPEPAIKDFTDELRHAHDTRELLIGIYEVLKPAFLATVEQHLAVTNPVADHPTRRLLSMIATEERAQLAWGEAALAALRNGSPDTSKQVAFASHLRAYLAAAGGVSGENPRPDLVAAPLPAPIARKGEPPPVTRVPRRDARFKHVWRSRGVVPSPASPVHQRLWWMMNVRLQEMHVSELIATVIADWTGQPWAFYHELARHLWDETRHCMLGEVAFAAQGIDHTTIPTHIGFAEYPNEKLPAPERYAFLWGIEQGLMVKSGKQAEVALAHASGNELAEVFQDYDWADEVLHAAIGRRWLEPHFKTREAMLAVYERIRPAYDQMKEDDFALGGRDWFPEFYQKHLAHKDPNLGRAEPEAPPLAGGGY